MDPDACLERIADADTRGEIRDACEDLLTWLQRGGFAPTWGKSPKGTDRFETVLKVPRKRWPSNWRKGFGS